MGGCGMARRRTSKHQTSGCLFFIVILLFGFWLDGALDDARRSTDLPDVQVVREHSSEVPDDEKYVGLLDEVLSVTTGAEAYDASSSGRSEVEQMFYDMEPLFYTDSIAELRYECGYPASVFWVDDVNFLSHKSSEGELLYYSVSVTYKYSREERDRMQQEVDAAANEILSKVPADADMWTKALTVHDELVKRTTYDHSLSKEHIYDIYGVLVEREAVCTGYAKAFEYLMGKLGESAYYVKTKYDPTEGDGHAWNYFDTSDGLLYIDVTWDDPDLFDMYGRPYIEHDYFGVTAAELTRVESHDADITDLNLASYSVSSYHAKTGYYLWNYERSGLIDILGEQYRNGSNLLTVKFPSRESFENAMLTLCGSGWSENSPSDTSELSTVINAAVPESGVNYYYVHQDGLYILNVFLYTS